MSKIVITAIALLFSFATYGQQKADSRFYAPRSIEQTIGEKYVLLPVDSNKKDYGYLLHKWASETEELPFTPASDAGRVVALVGIVSSNHAKLNREDGVMYFQYFKNADDSAMPNFAPAADYEKLKSLVNKKLWLKADKQKVTITHVELTPDNNAPFKLTYKYANGKQGAMTVALSGINSKVTDKMQLFDSRFSVTAL
ncbi:hypothetical protein D0C36_17965 [Mucilaginibacter conchicola]|uniref:Uncharacterized protein n=1 Tax=Mucilaginibacter conchicola TaxID=2303333 RepID=A0A372NPP9_9SPHI|nr:hypothetical protein [Mucilaginibacter conchicola]RFZ90838.1 hypothetical protein D0C36_17965 [Mucilaginibacter conchicola]